MREKLLSLLVQHSYERADHPKFKLSSGVMSDTYIDCKATMLQPDALPLIGEVCAAHIPDDAESVGGLMFGAVPIAHAIQSYLLYVHGRRVNVFAVRKTPKEHGKQKFIEGNAGRNAIVVDDVVTTGGSTVRAIESCRDEGIKVLAVVVLVDREENDGLKAVQRAAGRDVPVHAIFTKSELANRWHGAGGSYVGSATAGSHAVAS